MVGHKGVYRCPSVKKARILPEDIDRRFRKRKDK